MYDEFSDDKMEQMEGHGGSNSVLLAQSCALQKFQNRVMIAVETPTLYICFTCGSS